jgi:uncharacterized protein (DUF58 family)
VARTLATALLGIGLCLVGAAFDSASLYLPGVAILLLSAACAAWVALAARGASVTRAPLPATVVEGEPFRVRVEAHLGSLAAPGGELSDPSLGRARPLAGTRRVHLDGTATLPRRGPARLAPSELTLRDPLGVAARRVRAPEGPELLVLPRIEPVAAAGPGSEASSGGGGLGLLGVAAAQAAAGHDGGADGLDLDGLRPYREGTPATRIHWATLARRGEMMERRFSAGGASAPLVVLDAAAPTSGDALDAAVRATGSLCVALARAGGVALLLPDDRRPVEIDRHLGAWPALHKRLALVEAGARPSLAGLGSRSGALVWVTGAAGAAVPPELARLPLRPRYLVAPQLPAGLTAELEVAGCRGAALDRQRQRRGVVA